MLCSLSGVTLPVGVAAELEVSAASGQTNATKDVPLGVVRVVTTRWRAQLSPWGGKRERKRVVQRLMLLTSRVKEAPHGV